MSHNLKKWLVCAQLLIWKANFFRKYRAQVCPKVFCLLKVFRESVELLSSLTFQNVLLNLGKNLSRRLWETVKISSENDFLAEKLAELFSRFCGRFLLQIQRFYLGKTSDVLYSTDSECAGKYWSWRTKRWVKRQNPTTWSRFHPIWNGRVAKKNDFCPHFCQLQIQL